ncbi:MAG: diacylglycerol kinase family lipid kinase [Lachnospiraceae bacterium]|nr:diacylglycerol kinase family lipid kinase [Lachnospiraceae bacterium]
MIHIIENASSGTDKKGFLEQIIKPYLSSAGEEYKIYFSEKPGDITRIAEGITAAEETVRIMIIGGDGSINELLSGIRDTKKVILSIIPTGSGNDFARSVGIPSDIKLALDVAVKRGRTGIIDLGEVTYEDGSRRKFIISSGIGFDAAVCEEAMHSKLKKCLNKVKLGKLSYGLIAAKQIFGAKRPDGWISLDGGGKIELNRILFSAFMNEPFEGGGFKFGPHASHSDGKLDLCVVDRIPRVMFFGVLPFALSGKHYMFKNINEYQASRIHFHADSPMWVHTDGEVTRQAQDMDIRILRSAINVTIP